MTGDDNHWTGAASIGETRGQGFEVAGHHAGIDAAGVLHGQRRVVDDRPAAIRVRLTAC